MIVLHGVRADVKAYKGSHGEKVGVTRDTATTIKKGEVRTSRGKGYKTGQKK